MKNDLRAMGLVFLLAFGCNGGEQVAGDAAIDAGGNDGGVGSGGKAGGGGAAGSAVGSGGNGGGGNTGSGGGVGSGGAFGSGGKAGSGGVVGSGGKAGSGGLAGSGGAIGSGGVSGSGGQTNLPAGVIALFPPPGGQSICPDPVLRITFSGTPTLGSSGKIQVFGSSGTAVASVDMAASTVTDTIEGSTFTLQRPVYVDGNSVAIKLKTKALSYGQTYYVTVDAGAIVPPSGSLSITSTTTWRFTTASAAPSNLTALTVALDGSGNFCTVQGAVSALPANNSTASTITIKDGIYHEVVRFKSKNKVTLHGQSRKGTIIRAMNNNNMNVGTTLRPLVAITNVSDLIVENLTIHNTTAQGGSQAEALRLGSCTRCVVRDADILSLQDTLLWDGTIYARNCYIAGNVDYVWGGGTVYFDTCEIHTTGRAGAIVQARNDASHYGYVFVDCKLTADSGITNDVLARIDVATYPASHVAYINCTMGSHISAAGWTITGTATSALRFWEYQSKNAAGTLIDVSKRASGSTQISASQAASMRSVTTVLGGWQPPQ